MRHRFHTEQWVPYPREPVFAFFADPANLPALLPAWQHARIKEADYVTPPGVSGKAAGAGSRLTISFRPVPLLAWRLEWEAFISEFQWNEFFCDEQRRGPFRYFRHCHRLRSERGGTVVRDEVEYEVPLGLAGELANTLVVRGQLRALFRHRQKMLPRLLLQISDRDRLPGGGQSVSAPS